MSTAITSLRSHPELSSLFQAAEGRFLTEEEAQQYLAILPERQARLTAAQEIEKQAVPVAGKLAKDVTTAYGYDAHHDFSSKKCFRDITLTIKYATLAMLMDDADWFRDKLLIWFKTILQSFRFPNVTPGQSGLHAEASHLAELEKLQPFQRSIYETYALLDLRMKEALSAEAYAQIHPYLATATDILAHD